MHDCLILIVYHALCVVRFAGVMACVIYGLTGAASMSWHMSLKAKRSASMQHFWDVLTFSMNASAHADAICMYKLK